MSTEDPLRQALALLRAGQKSPARELLRALLLQNRDNPAAWATLAQAAENDREAIFCLQQVLRLKPGDAWATQRLQALTAAPPPQAQPPSPATPISAPSVKRLPPEPSAPPPPATPVQPSPATPVSAPPVKRLAPEPSAPPPPAAPVQPRAPAPEPPSPEPPPPRRLGSSSPAAPSRTAALPAYSRLMNILWGLLALAVVATGFFIWNEFFATHKGDDQKALTAARAWTEAQFRREYDTMLQLVCNRYESEISDIQQTAMWTGLLTKPLGLDLSSEPPATLRYELLTLKGNQAQVHVTGLLGEAGAYLGPSFTEEIYTMKRENGQWKWCGQKAP